ncbi:hypothetical protein ACS0TY_021608 [Phlomoides rotata]
MHSFQKKKKKQKCPFLHFHWGLFHDDRLPFAASSQFQFRNPNGGGGSPHSELEARNEDPKIWNHFPINGVFTPLQVSSSHDVLPRSTSLKPGAASLVFFYPRGVADGRILMWGGAGWVEFALSSSQSTCDVGEIRLTELLKDTVWIERGSSAISAKVCVSLAQELLSIFMVPRLKKFHEGQNCIQKHQLVEAFISFLLQLLYHKTDSVFDSCNDRLQILEKELRFLRTVLGDTSLIRCGDDQEVEFQKLVSEFEAVANEAGNLLHFLLFSESGKMDEGISLVLNYIGLLKEDIIKFLPLMNRAYTSTETSVMKSLHVVDSLIYDLMNREDSRIADVEDPIKSLHEGLISLQSSIKEIGGPQPSEAKELRETLLRIGDMAHEAQYLVISFLAGDVPHWYFSNRLISINHGIELCGIDLRQIAKKHKFGELYAAELFTSQQLSQTNRYTELKSSTIGLVDKETYILDKLEGGATGLQVISIFGKSGLGKTTFAKKVYNNLLVSHRFDKVSWCVVSKIYQMRGILSTILVHIESKFGKDMVEESLVKLIQKTLKKRRYLIVLDDIWESNVLDKLLRCFPNDGNGSRILITTRNKDVAPPSSILYELPHLTNDQCWELLEKKVFGDQPCPPKLQAIGKQIAEHCSGLPLAVVIVAGILSRTRKEESTWEAVQGNLASYIFDDGENSVMQILRLSYKHLPQHLKPCFLYLGAFQKDKEIPIGKLMRLWDAEGFIRVENKDVKAVDCLSELIDRSLVMVVKRRSDGGVKTCTIHDMLRDLCMKKCEEENFLKFVESDNCSIYNEGDHLQTLQNSVTWSYCQNMRSLFGSSMMLPLHIRDMRLLRFLQFDCRSTYLTGIEFLVCLRYLIITDLPPSVGSLVNLEYLCIETNETVCLSSAIMTMKNLRHFSVGNEAIYGEDCNSSQTNNLQFLSRVVIKEAKDEEMLNCSPHLRTLKISTYRKVDLSFLPHLESLNIRFYGLGMEGIIFPSNIKKLTLFGTSLTSEEMSIIGRLENLEVLKLRLISYEDERWDTRDAEFQKLNFLKMEVENLTEWNVHSSEHFPTLEQLVLSDCSNLQEIPYEIGEITTLQVIEVQGICKKSLLESAKIVQQERVDMGKEELRIITNSARLSVEGSDVSIGLEAEAENVLEELVRGSAHLKVISILGMPGLGKTTFAKKLYNHPLVCSWFYRVSWCVVSQTYMRRSLLTKTLMNIDCGFAKETIFKMEEESIAEHIYKALKGRRYLIVMDDIWDLEVWDDLRRYFPDDGNGSRILVTSRNKDAIPDESIIHVLPSLSNDQCWELLKMKVFDHKPCPPQLLWIGKKIAASCRGLPHAVVVTAGILASMDKEETTWEDVGGDLASHIFDDGKKSVMERSFQHLPEYLKPCLLYFGVFRENEQINVRELLRFWIAEGFLGKNQERNAEIVAEEYLMELIDRNLVMVSERRSDGGVKTCFIHDLLRPLCLQICEGKNIQMFTKSGDEPRGAGGGSRLLEHIRSLLGHRWITPSCVRDTRLLRILHCGYINSRYTGIEFLVSLKYLVIGELPPSIGSFVNLEYLRVEKDEEVNLPSPLMKMKKLKSVQVFSGATYSKDCETSQTNNLEFLSRIWIGEPNDEEMLKCSPYLRKLNLSTSHSVDLSFLTQLESLNIRFYDSGMEGISFASNIKKLTLCGYESKFDWEKMSIIGRLVNLEVLKLKWFSSAGYIWDTREGEFLKLRFLKLDGMIDLTFWIVDSSEHFPKLKRLILRNCYHLKEIPSEIGEIGCLEMIEVEGRCPESLVESAIRIHQQQCEDYGNEQLKVIVIDAYRDITQIEELNDGSEAVNATNAMSIPF